MAITVEAIYEDGVLKLAQVPPLRAGERVQISVEPKRSAARESAGLLKWTGDPAVLRRIVEDPECGILESP
jgi:predicted DNA-binding antitoxin AbrB/MazE fold protein